MDTFKILKSPNYPFKMCYLPTKSVETACEMFHGFVNQVQYKTLYDLDQSVSKTKNWAPLSENSQTQKITCYVIPFI